VYGLAGDPGPGRPAAARAGVQLRDLGRVPVDVLGDPAGVGVPPAGEVGEGVPRAVVQPARFEIRPAEPERSL